jgi:DNA-binding GntR family transcriptional regulator
MIIMEDPKQFSPIIKAELTTEKVYLLLKNSIMSLEFLKPGQELSENILAKQLHVSRTPVREAFKRLEQEELVQTIPQKGTHVLKLSSTNLKETAQLRCVLEVWAGNKAIDELRDADIKKMVAFQKAIHQKFDNKEFLELIELDTAFHHLFLEAVGNTKVIKTVDQMNLQLHRLRLLWLKTGKYVNDWGVKPHEDIITAFQKRDINLLETSIKMHLRFDDIINEMQQEWPEYFE